MCPCLCAGGPHPRFVSPRPQHSTSDAGHPPTIGVWGCTPLPLSTVPLLGKLRHRGGRHTWDLLSRHWQRWVGAWRRRRVCVCLSVCWEGGRNAVFVGVCCVGVVHRSCCANVRCCLCSRCARCVCTAGCACVHPCQPPSVSWCVWWRVCRDSLGTHVCAMPCGHLRPEQHPLTGNTVCAAGCAPRVCPGVCGAVPPSQGSPAAVELVPGTAKVNSAGACGHSAGKL